MTITAEDLQIRRQQHAIAQLVCHKDWHMQSVGQLSNAEYQARLHWLTETLGEPYTEYDELESHGLFRWASTLSIDSKTKRITEIIFVFRIDQDHTLFLLRWL